MFTLLETFRNSPGLQTTVAAEWAWIGGRLALVGVAAVGSFLLFLDTSSFVPVLAAASFALAYNAVLALLLWKGHPRVVLVAGLVLDTLTFLVAWWLVVKASDGTSPNDLYLILFPLAAIGVMRLGSTLGLLYILLLLGWMVWIALALYPPDAYGVEQLPVRAMVFTLTGGLVIRLTAIINRERRLERLRLDQLQRVEKFKSDLLRSIGHELRTPLTGIKTATDLLGAELNDNATQRQQTQARMLARSVEKVEWIVQRTLEYGRTQTSTTLRLQKVDVGSLVKQTVRLLEADIRAKRHHMSMSWASDLPKPLVDPAHLQCILINVLDNAVRYSPAESIINVRAGWEENLLHLEVEDTGPGIPEADLAFIFFEYYRGSGADHHQEEGLGLGLPMAKHLVEVHGGRIGITSQVGSGTRVFFTLPLLRSSSRHGFDTRTEPLSVASEAPEAY